MSRRFIGRALFGAGALAALSTPSPFGLGLATTLAIVGSLVIHLADQQDAPIPPACAGVDVTSERTGKLTAQAL